MGLATARAFAEAGAAVVIADIDEAKLGTVADELTAAGHRAVGVRCNVSDEDSVAAMVRSTVATFGREPENYKAVHDMIEQMLIHKPLKYHNVGTNPPTVSHSAVVTETYEAIKRGLF